MKKIIFGVLISIILGCGQNLVAVSADVGGISLIQHYNKTQIYQSGQSYTLDLELSNTTDSYADFDVTISQESYGQGIPLWEWLDVSSRGSVPARQSIFVPVTLTIPKDVDAGVYTGVVMFTVIQKNTDDEILNTISLTNIIQINISGELAPAVNAGITDFRVSKSIVVEDGLRFEIDFENRGETILYPRGEIEIHSKMGDFSKRYGVNESFEKVFPGERATLLVDGVQEDGEEWNIGLIDANLSLQVEAGGFQMYEKTQFIYLTRNALYVSIGFGGFFILMGSWIWLRSRKRSHI